MVVRGGGLVGLGKYRHRDASFITDEGSATGIAIRTLADEPTFGAQATVQFKPYLGRPISRGFLA